jgi:hypothetical protein
MNSGGVRNYFSNTLQRNQYLVAISARSMGRLAHMLNMVVDGVRFSPRQPF